MKTNPFLNQLLQYEQDGKSAVSSPSNWNDKPLLEVKTEIDEFVDELAEDLICNSEVARWHFFIGSPGNGKSAAVGRLYRTLQSKGVVFKTQDNAIYSPQSKELPYVLYAYLPDNKHSFAYFTQDASVVKDPYAIEISPARDMLNLINEAWAKRKCLIICANRGVIEEAIRIGEEIDEFKNEEWFKVFLRLIKSEEGERDFKLDKKFARTKLKYSSSILDFRSIVLNGQNESNVFDQLITQAVESKDWVNCETCNFKKLCPFKNNRDFFLSKVNKEKLIKIVKRAEVYSGQVIVFREALALIAFFFAGCSEDLIKENVLSPCEWVQKKIYNEEYFDLLGRRIYMVLFSSYSPYGLEIFLPGYSNENIAEAQKNALRNPSSSTKSRPIYKRLFEKFNNSWLSLNVGLNRLIGEKGVIKKLHPIWGIPLNNYEKEIQDQWDLQLDTLVQKDHELITQIEKTVFTKFKELEDAILTSTENISEKLSWLSRWVTSITYNIGVLSTCMSNFDRELDELILAFENPGSEEAKKIRRKLRESVKKIFDEENKKMIHITKNMAIVDFEIKDIAIDIPQGESKTYGLEMRFGGKKNAVVINIQTYCWLIRKFSARLSSSTFPGEFLDTLKVFQIKAVKDLSYNTMPDVNLLISTGEGKEYPVIRDDGEIEEPKFN